MVIHDEEPEGVERLAPTLLQLVDIMPLVAVSLLKQFSRSRQSPSSALRRTVRRLVNVLQQLDLTYDTYSLEVNELLGLLPAEFDRFKT